LVSSNHRRIVLLCLVATCLPQNLSPKVIRIKFDQISDTILDALLNLSRVAAEVVVNTGLVLITGEITTNAQVNYVNLVRNKIAEIGYTDAVNGFCSNSCVLVAFR